MSQSINELRENLTRYTRPVVDIRDLRLKLRIERERRGWTQATLADKSGVKQPIISRIESIEKKPDLVPELPTLLQLVSALGIPIGLFFDQLDGAPPSTMSPKNTSGGPVHQGGAHGESSTIPSRAAHDALKAFIHDLIAALHDVVETDDARREGRPARKQTQKARRAQTVRDGKR